MAGEEYQKEMNRYVEEAEDPLEARIEVWDIQVELRERTIGHPWE